MIYRWVDVTVNNKKYRIEGAWKDSRFVHPYVLFRKVKVNNILSAYLIKRIITAGEIKLREMDK